jgi:hypothetical protein
MKLFKSLLAAMAGVFALVVVISVLFAGADQRIEVAVYLAGIAGTAAALGAWWLAHLSRPGRIAPLVRFADLRRSRREPRPPTPSSVVEWEGIIAAGQRSGRAASLRLLNRLQALTRERLAERGVDLDRSPREAAALLGPTAWALVDPAQIRRTDQEAPGVAIEQLDELVDRLERL